LPAQRVQQWVLGCRQSVAGRLVFAPRAGVPTRILRLNS
jgi:hypothetical protein